MSLQDTMKKQLKLETDKKTTKEGEFIDIIWLGLLVFSSEK